MDINQDHEYQLGREHTVRKTRYRDTDTLERNWKHMRSTYRKRYPTITDEDVSYRIEDFDTMTERIAQRTNRSQQDVVNDIRYWNHEEEL